MAQIRQLFGCEPVKLSTNVLQINPGLISDYYATGPDMEFPSFRQIDLTQTGLWGIDAGPVVNGELYVYAVRDDTTGDYGLIASQSRFFGGVTVPAGYSVKRKLPWGVMYNTAWDGIPSYHLSHWPNPSIRLTDSEFSDKWRALWLGDSNSWADVDVSAWIPDNARMAYVSCEVRYSSGSAGSAFVRSYGAQSAGVIVGTVGPNSLYNTLTLELRIDSLRKFQYRITAGARLIVSVLGYSMTEPA